MEAVCKTVARATLVRIQPCPFLPPFISIPFWMSRSLGILKFFVLESHAHKKETASKSDPQAAKLAHVAQG